MTVTSAAFRADQAPYLHGYSPTPVGDLLRFIQGGGDVSDLTGDFVVVNPSPVDGFAVSSFLSALPYYYALSAQGHLVTGACAFEVAARAGLAWRWNERTIRSLALYGHSINDDTLCEGVYRLPPATRVSVKNGALKLEALPVRRFLWDEDTTQERAFGLLKRSFEGCVGGAASEVHLSLSAGYDSRLLLALCLDRGIKPQVSVMGYDNSTDVIMARAICQRVGLRLQVIALDPTDYLRHGARIAATTSGVKTAVNWHTYLYHLGKDFSRGVHLVGSNGEFARSFFFDKPRFDPLAKHAPAVGMNAYWFARCARRMMKFSRLNPLVGRNPLPVLGLAQRASVGRQWTASRFLPALDAFYAEQRVRHFIGGGLACYAAHGSPRSPFLDAPWMRAIAAMGRRFKQGNRFHADSTERLWAPLAEFTYNRLPDQTQGESYHPFGPLVKSDEVTELLVESSCLDGWTSRADRVALLTDAQCDQVEERNLWLTLHFAATAQRSVQAAVEQGIDTQPSLDWRGAA